MSVRNKLENKRIRKAQREVEAKAQYATKAIRVKVKDKYDHLMSKVISI